jgi:dipeptidase
MKRLVPVLFLACAAFVAQGAAPARACTNYLIAKGATADGSTLITYSADSHELYGELYYRPAAVHAPGAMREIVEWDTGKRLGAIPEAPRTYARVGNMNEHQVSVGETTFGGRKELKDPESVIDYGSLMYIALERAKTAREAIEVMTSLAETHGFYSDGESFSVADPNEVWILEMVGKGKGGKGALWVARRVPDGYVSAHANKARIRQFPANDPKNTLFAKDVVKFARDKGWFTGEDKDFSFADAYDPMSFSGVRYCESRVWRAFTRVAPGENLPIEMAKGIEGGPILPLWVKPAKPLGVQDVMELMRDHFEGTEFDLSKGVGAGPYACPYRWRPLDWEYEGGRYLNERAVSTQQTGFSFVAQARATLPGPIGGVLWFGVDDTFSTVYVPMYAGIREAPVNFAVGTGTFTQFTWDSAFWVFNAVAGLAYARYSDIIPIVRREQAALEGSFLALQPEIDKAALDLWQRSPEAAREYLTAYSAKQAALTVKTWRGLWERLFVKFLDGNVRDELGKVTHPAWPKSWMKRIVDEAGPTLKVNKFKGEPEEE